MQMRSVHIIPQTKPQENNNNKEEKQKKKYSERELFIFSSKNTPNIRHKGGKEGEREEEKRGHWGDLSSLKFPHFNRTTHKRKKSKKKTKTKQQKNKKQKIMMIIIITIIIIIAQVFEIFSFQQRPGNQF